MKRVEKLAEKYYQDRPEGFGNPTDDFEAGYRQAIEDAAKVCDQGDGSMSSMAEEVWGNGFRDKILTLPDQEVL